MVISLGNWCLEPSQPQKDYIRAEGDLHKEIYSLVQRTNKAEIRSEEQSQKVESCRKNLWNGRQFKGP